MKVIPPQLPEAPKRRCLCYLKGLCPCNKDAVFRKLWQTNVYDTVDTLGEVMKLLGLNVLKVYRALPAIAYCFFKFKERITRIDGPRRKYFNRLDLLHELAYQAAMTRIEAQLTYSIVKRAFRAFYFVTDQYGLPDEDQLPMMKHRSQCHWVHAAESTAHIHSYMEGLPITQERIYAKKIQCFYKKLYDRMMHRIKQLQEERLQKKCAEKIKIISKKKIRRASVYSCEGTIERCKCPKLECECEPDLHELMTEPKYSQGPYECFWRLELDDVEIPFELEPEKVCTPSHESEEEVICDSECLCTCTECECSCESSGTEVYEEEMVRDEEDPCANLKKLLGQPEYREEKQLVDDRAEEDRHEDLCEDHQEDLSECSEEHLECVEDKVEDKRETEIPTAAVTGSRRPRRKPKRPAQCKRKTLPCCVKCVTRKLKAQNILEICKDCLCDSDAVIEFPDDDTYRT